MSVDTANRPSGASDPAIAVYKFMDISSTAASSDFSLIKIKFKVPKSWISSNSVDSTTISLFRYSSGWTKLTTAQTSTDDAYYYFEAISPGFSTFAVAAEKGSATTPAPTSSTPTPSTPSTPTTETGTGSGTSTGTTTTPAVPVGSTDPNVIIGIVILILAVGFGIVHHYMLKGKGGYKHNPLREVYAARKEKKEKEKYEYRPGKK